MKILAHIYEAHKKEFLCKIDSGNKTVSASAKGTVLKGNQLVAGDKVLLEKNGDDYQIVDLVERTNEIFRMNIRERKKRITAANCDLVIIATSVSRPLYKQGVIDRFATRSFQWDLPATVVFNKMDEFEDDFDIDFEMRRFENLGIECFEVSAEYPETSSRFGRGSFKDLQKKLLGTQSIILGQSGVGKSKLVTALSDKKVRLASYEIGKGGKGVHTTSWSEMIDCGIFRIIDSPGIRSFSLDDISPEELINFFPDLLPITLTCQFNDCQHESTTKGCAFYRGDIDSRTADIIGSRL
ncbi:MAG TPA: ribosome small subunit-dependent GTPase A, partial [Nitrospirae bacterium]|nr:ribosome small subunit-dependent GTPase A [Nitrospirota bacterium]HEW81799.1 ribosome small subunit-dependent GTPase A [Nitrospirota bacterium]